MRIAKNGNIGIGLTAPPGQKLHIGDGNILLEGGGETAFQFKRDFTVTGGPSGPSTNPIFQVGRIQVAGDGDPEFRVLYEDDEIRMLCPMTEPPTECARSVLKFDRKGIIASVKPDRGSHFEGFLAPVIGGVPVGDQEPLFRLNSFPSMQLEMGPGGSMPTDVMVRRADSATLTFRTGAAPADNERMRVTAAGNIGIGTTTPAFTLDVAGAAHASSFPTSSDARLKTNVTQLTNVLEKIEKIHGVSFEWNALYASLGRSTARREIGVIAQEVEAVFPELTTAWGDEGYRAVDYGRLTGVLVEAVKELRAEKEAQIAALEARLAALEQTGGKNNPLMSLSFSILSAGWLFLGGLFLVGFWLGQRWRAESRQ